MKINDIVKLEDGSYNMLLTKGTLEHSWGIFHQHRRYRVLDVSGAYPTNRIHAVTPETNDTMLVDVDDLDFVLFTQEQFCNVVTPAPEKLLPGQTEVVIPRGIKEVRLILQ